MNQAPPALLAELEAALAARPKPGAPKARLLVADDHEDYRGLLSYLLKSHNYQVVEAADGETALRLAVESPPDLIVADFNMPHRNGYELMLEVRSRMETRSIPFIIMTGVPNRRHIKDLLTAHCSYLEKPVPNTVLLEAIARALPALHKQTTAPAPEPLHVEKPAVGVPKFEPQPAAEHAELRLFEEEKDDSAGLEQLDNDSPLVHQVNRILVQAVDLGASDIHIEPYPATILVRARINGALVQLCTLPRNLAARLAARVKIMANLVITERRLPQDGQIRARIKDKKVEFRVSTLPGMHGEKVVIRVLGGSKVPDKLEQLGLEGRDLDCVRETLSIPHGLILVTGPTGSGKTTTLYTMIKTVAAPDVNVVTAEDPVEYEMAGITQVPVRPAIGLTFESVLRAFLRQDPDVMLVGEIRDLETAQIAVKASITGHQVFSTLHTNSAPATAVRLAHMGVPAYLVSASLKLCVAQRLIRTLCKCKEATTPPEAELRLLSDVEASSVEKTYKPGACSDCKQTGYSGRKPLFEVMPVRSAEMRRALLKAEDPDGLGKQAVEEGMSTLRRAALRAAAEGQTSLTEALKVMMGD